MNERFRAAAQALLRLNEDRGALTTRPAPWRLAREAALIEALQGLAQALDVRLRPRPSLRIDENGEIALFAERPFGRRFAAMLNRVHPRRGTTHDAILDDTASWCHVAHAQLESLVLRQYEKELALRHLRGRSRDALPA